MWLKESVVITGRIRSGSPLEMVDALDSDLCPCLLMLMRMMLLMVMSMLLLAVHVLGC